jgi:cytochrome c-type biogenesis protein CcmH
MTVFIAIAIAFICAMLFLALRPLWHASRSFTLGLAALCALLVAGMYVQFGSPQAINFKAPSQEQEISNALAELEALVKQQPQNSEARILLAQSLMQLGRFESAQIYFAQAQKLQPTNANLMVDYAESLFRSTSPDQLNPEAKKWIDSALSLEPANQRALFFKGILLLQAKQPAQAAAVWEQLLPNLDESTAQALLPQINQARQQAGMPELALAPAKSLQVIIDLEPSLKAQTPPGSILFVTAKDPNQAGPPLAAKRIELSQFPLRISLSASDSIMPTAKLFSQKTFLVSARISASGSVQTSSADWLSEPVLVQSDKLTSITLILRRQP